MESRLLQFFLSVLRFNIKRGKKLTFIQLAFRLELLLWQLKEDYDVYLVLFCYSNLNKKKTIRDFKPKQNHLKQFHVSGAITI